MKLKNIWYIFLSVIFFFSCEESLPPRIVPQNTLEITEIIANQEANNDGIFIAVRIIGENKYVETFQDTVNVEGNIHIWWMKHPEIEANVPLDNRYFVEPTRIQGSILTIDPGGEFHLETRWYLNTDDGKNIIDLLDFSHSPVVGGIVTAAPEKFMLEVQLTLFKQTGLLRSKPLEFIFTGWKMADTNPQK
jgi:hypothetical protein